MYHNQLESIKISDLQKHSEALEAPEFKVEALFVQFVQTVAPTLSE